ncbi:MAG: carbohydrate ABC transporter permease [Phycisphaerales bacterium]|nr:MAG: carbohydrate ABC transporter permease [Phycisphaerales bacterium]
MSAAARPNWIVRWLVHLVTYAVALTMIAPFGWMISTSLKTNRRAIDPNPSLLPDGPLTQWQWHHYLEAWRRAQLGDFYLNSIIVAVVVTALSVLFCAIAGFAFAKLRFAGRRITFAILLATLLLPYQVYFIFAYFICSWLGYIDQLHALIVPFLASAFGIFYMRQSIVTVPDSLLDAGRIDGFTDFELFVNIIVPAVRPALAALAIFTFMASWNNFFWPLIVIDSSEHITLPLAVERLSAGQFVDSWPQRMAAATIITVPTIFVFVLFQRSFVEGLALTGVKG